jgi:5-methylcytosine-specific restriction endonuclease McrA
MLALTELTSSLFLKPIPRETPCGSMKSRYKTFKRRVLERDGCQCTECGSTENLTVHHLKKVADYPVGMYIMDNCVTLCLTCHCNLHNKG